jgi:hypothetical protein
MIQKGYMGYSPHRPSRSWRWQLNGRIVGAVFAAGVAVVACGSGGAQGGVVLRGYLSSSCYLIGVEAGFELWRGGAGLATTSFSLTVR